MKNQRPRRKVIAILVEGPSEIRALSHILSSLYDDKSSDYEVFFPSMTENGIEKWGDLTAKFGITPLTIEKCIDKLYFKDFLRVKKLYPKDLSEIVHIFDMDGAYIDDSCIYTGNNPHGNDKPFYASNGIITPNVKNIIERNEKKRENIDYLCSLKSIKIGSKSIPYSTYFFSSNLDHFLHNNANLIDGREKIKLAEDFALDYAYEPAKFIMRINDTPGVLSDMSYEESWDFIRKRGLNSLERHTNINHLFKKLV